MGSQEQSVTVTDSEALEWAKGIVAFDAAELVSDSPWARTHRLHRGEQVDYLKIVPQRQTKIVVPTVALAQHFHQSIPKLIAFDTQRGWLLSAAHGGRALDYGSTDQDIAELARTYARLQADAAKTPALFRALPQPAIATLPALLLEFLRPDESTLKEVSASVGAGYFIGRDEAARYHRALQRRLALLEQHLLPAAELPLTINHGDLRPPNAAIGADGRCLILDWDDALVGPAGMSLHGLFSGCIVPTILLSGSAAAEAASGTADGLLIRAYVDALAAGGYSDAATLKRALPASMCAGMIQFMLNFAGFPGESGRSAVRDTLHSRLNDLLDICDVLASRDPQTALDLAQDYEDHDELRRAQNLLQDHSVRHPGDASASVRLGALLRKRGQLEQAEQTYREAIALAPAPAHAHAPAAAADAAQLHAGLGAVLMEQLDVAQGKRELQHALDLDPHLEFARDDLERVLAIEQMQHSATQPGQMPTLRFTADETAAGVVRPEKIALGSSLFETYGTLQIDNAFPVETIARLHDAFMQRYSPYFREDNHPDALRLGDKRYMLTVDLEAPFNDTAIIAAPMVLPIIRKLLGDDCVLGAYTAVISLPGSLDQRLHKDHPALFPDTEWHFKLPCFAAQIIIPLVPLDELTGTTRFYKGTHRIPTELAEETGSQDPLVPLGSCLLTDYRCAHRGRGNRSQQVRPILTLIFNRPWFRDYKNYGKQPPLRFSDAAYQQMPADFKRLVSWWKEERLHNQLERSVLG